MDFPFANVGPLTSAFEVAATSIGYGLVVGGFFGGIPSSLWRRPREESERKAVIGSYAGGFASLLALAVDIVRKHFV